MRLNEFDTHNNLEIELKHFFEGKISSKDFSSYIKENQITEADLLEGPLSGIFKNAPKLWNKFKDAFKGSKQGELPLKGGSNTRPSAPAAASKPPAAAPKTKPSNVGKVAGGAALGAAGTAAVLGTGGDAGPDAAGAAGAGAAPKAGKPDGEQSFGQAFAAARKAQGGPGGVFTYKGKQYQTNIKGEKYAKNPTPVGPNKTLALQQKLKAAGFDIKADGIMGPKTRAAAKTRLAALQKRKAELEAKLKQQQAPARPSAPAKRSRPDSGTMSA